MKQFVSNILNTVLVNNKENVKLPKTSVRVYYSVLAAVGTASLSVLVYHFTRMGQSLTRSSKNNPDTSKTSTSTGTNSNGNGNGNTKTSLLQLAMEGNIDSIKSLISQHISCSNSSNEQKETIQRFVNESDGEGNTALHGAIFSGHLSLVQYLINECGADITLKNGMECSPLWIAAGYGHVSILQYLMEYITAAHPATLTDTHKDSSRRLIHMLRDPNNTGDTPLLAAVSKGHIDVCRLLLDAVHTHDTNPNGTCAYYEMLCDTNKPGDTPLSVCVGCAQDGPLLNLLLDWEEKQPRQWEQSNQQQQPQPPQPQPQPQPPQRPLNAKNNNGLTPLLVACERNSAATVEELILKRGASTIICDDKGRSPLAVAAFCGCEDVVRKILSLMPTTHDKPNNSKNDNSVDQDNYVIVLGHEMLDYADKLGCTPLWLAARTGNAKMVQILVEAGADVTIQNNDDGLTPENVAIKFKKEKVNTYFRELAASG